MADLQRQDEILDKFEMDYFNTKSQKLKMQSEADAARRVPDTSSMTGAELVAALVAHEVRLLNADREAREASDRHAGVCREFREWCAQQRDSIPRDPNAEGQKLHEKIVKRLAELEAACLKG